MRTHDNWSPFCIYTIVQSGKLDEIHKNGGTAKLTEGKPWTNAKQLLAKAHRDKLWMPIIFAAAEDTKDLIYYAEITKIALRHDATTYFFTNLTPIDGCFPKTRLTLKSKGKRIRSNFIKPYAICRTPAFLKKQLANNGPVPRTKHVRIDRKSPEVAELVLNQLLPNQSLQRLILEELAKSISVLPIEKEGIQWAVTLSANYVRLNIGRIEAFMFDKDKVRVLVSDSEVNQGLREKIRKFDRGRYKAIPSAVSVNMSYQQFSRNAKDLKGPHTTFINQALAEGRDTNHASSHSPGLIQFIKKYIPIAPSKLNELPNLSRQEREDAEIEKRSDIGPTEKLQLTQVRCKQGVFRANVMSHHATVCRVTGISIPEHLIASHIKPWCESTEEEQISGHNGLLLAPHIDHLFDGGWISFKDDGSLLISQSLNRDVLAAWGISDQLIPKPFNEKQSEFLEYHRKHVFKR
ncbi:MAG: hypothetical protein NTAFB01_18570 [Nitrospira sp.]